MEISEGEWAKIKADVALHGAITVLLVKASPRCEEIISAVRRDGEAAYADLLGRPLSDVQVEQFGKVLQRFLSAVEER